MTREAANDKLKAEIKRLNRTIRKLRRRLGEAEDKEQERLFRLQDRSFSH
jgi:hypothetical protein